MNDEHEPISFLGHPLPPAFERRLLVLEPGQERAYDEAEWRDAIVVVEHGTVELELLSGVRQRFSAGDVLWLVGLGLRALHNPAGGTAVVAGVARRRAGAEPGVVPSRASG
jgi:hypothetical protein